MYGPELLRTRAQYYRDKINRTVEATNESSVFLNSCKQIIREVLVSETDLLSQADEVYKKLLEKQTEYYLVYFESISIFNSKLTEWSDSLNMSNFIRTSRNFSIKYPTFEDIKHYEEIELKDLPTINLTTGVEKLKKLYAEYKRNYQYAMDTLYELYVFISYLQKLIDIVAAEDFTDLEVLRKGQEELSDFTSFKKEMENKIKEQVKSKDKQVKDLIKEILDDEKSSNADKLRRLKALSTSHNIYHIDKIEPLDFSKLGVVPSETIQYMIDYIDDQISSMSGSADAAQEESWLPGLLNDIANKEETELNNQ